jgi:hypothetical protein
LGGGGGGGGGGGKAELLFELRGLHFPGRHSTI